MLAKRCMRRLEKLENLLGNNIARATINSVSRPRRSPQSEEMRYGSSVARLSRQWAKEIALGKVMCTAIGIARSLIWTKLRQCIGSNYSMAKKRARNIGDMFAYNGKYPLGKTLGEVPRPRSISHINQVCTVATRTTRDFKYLNAQNRFSLWSTRRIKVRWTVNSKCWLCWKQPCHSLSNSEGTTIQPIR